MQRIIVKNFGPLKDIDLEIKDYMIFIGPQASGKSTLAKLIYFFRTLDSIFKRYSYERITNTQLRKQSEKFEITKSKHFIYNYFFEVFSIQSFNNGYVRFQYSSTNFIELYIKVDEIKTVVSNGFSESFDLIYSETLNNYLSDENERSLEERYNRCSKPLVKVINDFFKNSVNRTFFIPDGRSLFSTISNQIYKLDTENLDFLLKGFFALTNYLKDYISSLYTNETIFTVVDRISKNILKGELYENENFEIELKLDNDTSVPLNFISSGQKEALWVVEYISEYLKNSNSESRFTIIEEPEAHLYPEAQRDITYLISLLANQEGNQVLITTHSPYILASLNNLIYAYRKGQIDEQSVNKTIPKELWVNPAKLFVGEMQNGRIKEIIDAETGLIEVERLDKVSENLGEDFEKLYEIHEPEVSL